MGLPLGLAPHSEENVENCDPAVGEALLNARAWYALRSKLLMYCYICVLPYLVLVHHLVLGLPTGTSRLQNVPVSRF